MPEIIQVKNLTKKYGDFTAVDNISFKVKTGAAFGILGPNGAGKTTTLEMIEGLRSITSGEVLVDDLDVRRKTRQVKEIIGVQLQASSFFDGLNLMELLHTFASFYNRRIDPKQILEEVQLQDKAKSKVKELSGGQKQRLSIAAGLVNDPKILFLDEPTTGLDPQARHHLWDLINKIRSKGKTIVLTTHYMEEAEVLCDQVAIMDHAKIIALNTPYNLLKNSGVDSVISFRLDKLCPKKHFLKLPAVVQAIAEDHGMRLISTNPEETLPALFSHEQECQFKLFDLALRQATLEDVFLKLTGAKLRE